jgi:hypothetical protein
MMLAATRRREPAHESYFTGHLLNAIYPGNERHIELGR